MKLDFLDRPRVRRLRALAVGGSASIVVSVAATNLLRIVSSMTLTRLLDAHAYGVVGVITSVAFMLTMLSDIGLFDFIVRHKEGADPRFLDQLWTIRLVRGAALTVLMIATARPIADLLGKPELAPVIAVWSCAFLFDGLSSLAFATAVREQRLWRLGLLDLGANLTTLLVSTIVALAIHSYWALLAGMLTGAAVKLVLSYILFPASRRRWRFDLPRSRELWGFSRYIAMSSLLSLLIMQTDKLVLARLMPLASFGIYSLATVLAAAPAAIAAPYAKRILLAAYATTARTDPASLGRVIYQKRRKVALLYQFGVGGLIGGAPLLVALLYDPRYAGVTPFLRLIAISVALRMSSLAAKQALLALGYTRSDLIANLFSVAWLALGGAVGLATGNILLLVAIVGTVELPAMLCFWFNLRRLGLLDLREEGLGLVAIAAGAAVGYVVAWGVLALFPSL